ncbi:MAG: TraR/DksA family transcriptional regulator [Actinomycetota bacterium]|nr:TraR/DksA family transcriptional regulator [Actinomycetota bacterium]
MARSLTKSNQDEFRRLLEAERDRLREMIDELEQELEEARLAEASSERSPDPTTGEGGSMAFEYEKELSIFNNAKDLLDKTEHALARLERGQYGMCESCAEPIPVARLEALPYATFCVSCAQRR